MVSQTLEDKLEQFLNEGGRLDRLESEIKNLKDNHLHHIDIRLSNLEKGQSEIKQDIKKLLEKK